MLSIRIHPGRFAAVGDAIICPHEGRHAHSVTICIDAPKDQYLIIRDIMDPKSTATDVMRARVQTIIDNRKVKA